jgi:hypothetical protein
MGKFHRTGRSGVGRPPRAVKALVEQMLEEGASPEEVLATAHQRGILGLSRRMVEKWVAHDGSLGERLIRRQAKAAEQLQRSLADDRFSPAARLAEAALFAGLAPSAQNWPAAVRHLAGVESARWQKLRGENERLRDQAQRLAARQRSITRRLRRAQARVERVRWELVQQRLACLRGALERRSHRTPLGSRFLQSLRSLCCLAESSTQSAVGSRQ